MSILTCAFLSLSSASPALYQPDAVVIPSIPATVSISLGQARRWGTAAATTEAEPVAEVLEWQEHEITGIDRPKFKLHYPANWTIAKSDSDYNPDQLFVINSTADSYVRLEIIQEPRDLKVLLASIVRIMDGYAINTYSRSKLNEWGHIQGEGVHLKGKVMSMFPGGIRIFVGQDKGNTLVVTEFYFSEDMKHVFPGFSLIQESFAFKE